MKSEVVILSCESYEEELVYSTLKKGIALLGGWETFLKKEEKILLKPNLVRKRYRKTVARRRLCASELR